MNKRGLNLIFTVVLVILLSFNANAELSFSAQETEKSICQSTTDVFTLFIKGTGNIIIGKEGAASSFSTIIPSSFETAVEKPVFVYITPNSKIQTGSYDLNLKIKDSSSEKEVPLKITVKNCNTFELSGELSKEVCSCNSQTYEYTVRNTGMYKETYSISVNGDAKNLVELDKKEVTIDPGKSSKVVATVKTTCNDKGTKGFTLSIESKTNKAVASADNSIIINNCFDYTAAVSEESVSMCEHTQQEVSISIDNTADIPNDYTLKVAGPPWANLDKEKLSINSKNKGIANLILTPDYGIEGDFDIKLGIESDSGNVNKENIIKVNVRKCDSISLESANPSETVCQSTVKNIPLKIKNTGEIDKTLQLSENSDWASIEEEIAIGSSEDKEVQLKLSPESTTPTGKYTVIVKAESLDESNIAEEISLEVQVIDVEKCYKPSIETKNKIEVLRENVVISDITVENQGEEKADYEISVTGTASGFIQINPSTITLESKQSEVMQVYIAPTIRIDPGTYFATISVAEKGSSISDNKEITIEVKRSEEDKLTGEVTKNLKEFKKETTVRESTEFILNGEEHKLEIQEVNENSITIKISSDPIFLVLNVSESKEVDINEDGTNDLKLTLESIEDGNPIIKVVEINSNEVKEDNGSFFSKYKSWIIGLIIVIILIVLASVFFSDDEEEEKEKGREEKIRIGRYIVGLTVLGILYWLFKKYSLLQKFNLYKFYIILGVVILLFLVLITKYWNNIIKFFEEEETEEEMIKEKVKEVIEKKENVEEEKTEVKEEPKKKTVKKKAPKK